MRKRGGGARARRRLLGLGLGCALLLAAAPAARAAANPREGIVMLAGATEDDTIISVPAVAIGGGEEGVDTFVTTLKFVDFGFENIAMVASDSDALTAVSVESRDEALGLAVVKSASPVDRRVIGAQPAAGLAGDETVYALGVPDLGQFYTEKGRWPGLVDDVLTEKGTVLNAALEINGLKHIEIDLHVGDGFVGGALVNEEGKLLGILMGNNEAGHCCALQIDYLLGDGEAAGGGSGGSPGGEGPAAGSPGGDAGSSGGGDATSQNIPYLLLGAAAVAAVAFLFYRGRHKAAPAPAAAPLPPPYAPGPGQPVGAPPPAAVQPPPAPYIPPAPPNGPVAPAPSYAPGAPAPSYGPGAPAPSYGPGAAGVPQITGMSGYFAGNTIQVRDSVSLGRDPARCQVIYPKQTPGVSGLHCTLRNVGGALELTDRGSTYGTFVGAGQKLAVNQPALLRSGDTFYLGAPQNTFKID